MTSIFQGIDQFRGLAAVVALALIGIYAVSFAVRTIRDQGMRAALVAAVSLDVIIVSLSSASNPVLTNDAYAWHTLSSEAAAYINGESLRPFDYVQGKEGYIWILGALYAVGGPTPLLAIVLNITAHLLCIAAVAKTTELLTEDRQRWGNSASYSAVTIAGLMVALLPAIGFWVPQILRETLTLLCVATAVTFATLAIVRKNSIFIALIALPLLTLTFIRQSLGLSVALAVAGGLLLVAVNRSRYRIILRPFLAIAIVWGMSAWMTASGLSENAARTTAELSGTAASGFSGLSFSSSIPEVLRVTAPRILFGPFPWELNSSAVMLLAFMEWACWVFVALLAVRGAKHLQRYDRVNSRWMIHFILAITLSLVLGLSFVVGNYGILARFRPMVTIVLIPLAAIGLGRASIKMQNHNDVLGKQER